MIEKLNWTSFSILYESTENFLALDNVLKMYGPYAYPVYAFYLGPGPNYRWIKNTYVPATLVW